MFISHLCPINISHANMMDDLLGAMLDIDDSVSEIMAWIDANGGYEKNALYVTADHDHYLTLLPRKWLRTNILWGAFYPIEFVNLIFSLFTKHALDFPEVVANLIIDGVSHNLTPENNTNTNTWEHAITAGRHEDDSKTQTEHLKDFSTWSVSDDQFRLRIYIFSLSIIWISLII